MGLTPWEIMAAAGMPWWVVTAWSSYWCSQCSGDAVQFKTSLDYYEHSSDCLVPLLEAVEAAAAHSDGKP